MIGIDIDEIECATLLGEAHQDVDRSAPYLFKPTRKRDGVAIETFTSPGVCKPIDCGDLGPGKQPAGENGTLPFP